MKEVKRAKEGVFEIMGYYQRAVDAYLATIGILRIFIPKIRKEKIKGLVSNLSEFKVECFKLSAIDRLEKSLKSDLETLLALGTKKSDSRVLNCFKGNLRKIVIGETIGMWKGGKRGRDAASFVRSLYESKRCWFKMSNALLTNAKVQHKDVLCGEERKLPESSVRSLNKAVDLVFPPPEMRGERTGLPLFKGYQPGSCVPTFKSSFLTGRKEGGNHGELLNDKEIRGGKLVENKDDPLDGKRWLRDEGYRAEFAKKMNIDVGLVGPGTTESVSKELYEHCIPDTGEERNYNNHVKYIGLQEAGKVRGITIGEAKPYTALRPFQKFMIARWKQMPFGTMVPDVFSRIGGLRKYMCSDTLYYSGDYSKATDNLSIDATLTVIRRLMKNLEMEGSVEEKLLLDTFGGAWIQYKDFYNPDAERYGMEDDMFKQLRGQFMGHPCSFVILCIINLATYLACMECFPDSEEELKLPRKVLINGDDILFISHHKSAGKLWRWEAEAVGLEVNEVKTYESSRWALINSIFVDMCANIEVRYVPLAAALGKNPKGEPYETIDQAPALWDLCLSGPSELGRIICCKLLKNRINQIMPKAFTKYRRRENRMVPIKKEYYPNFFLPRCLGGLGMRPIHPFKITYWQRKVAGYFVQHRDRIFLREQISELPESAKLAIRKCHIINGSGTEWVDQKGRPFYGPLNQGQDFEDRTKELLTRCLISTQFCFGPPRRVNYSSNSRFYVKALRDKGATLMKECKMRDYIPALKKVDNYDPPLQWTKFTSKGQRHWLEPIPWSPVKEEDSADEQSEVGVEEVMELLKDQRSLAAWALSLMEYQASDSGMMRSNDNVLDTGGFSIEILLDPARKNVDEKQRSTPADIGHSLVRKGNRV